jgi:hypothetical protein
MHQRSFPVSFIAARASQSLPQAFDRPEPQHNLYGVSVRRQARCIGAIWDSAIRQVKKQGRH